MSLYNNDPDNVWAHFESIDGPDPVMLPVEMADYICEFCRHLVPDTPAGCCWWCVWDLTGEQEDEYRQLIVAYETRIIAVLATHLH